MGQKSNIDKLPKALRAKLIEMLQDPAITQAEVVAAINADAGTDVVSKSSVNRYKLRMEKFARRSQEAREVAELYMTKYGADSRNKLGKMANESMRVMAYDLITEISELSESGEKPKPELLIDMVYKVSRALKDLEAADKANAERENEIREAILKETADKVSAACKQRGVTKEARAAVLAEVFGITE